MFKPALIGALTLSAALAIQDYNQGDSPNMIQLVLWLCFGALIGIGVAKIASRRKG